MRISLAVQVLMVLTTMANCAMGYVKNVRAMQLSPHNKIEVTYELSESVNWNYIGGLELSCSGTRMTGVDFQHDANCRWSIDNSVSFSDGGDVWKSGNSGMPNSSSCITAVVDDADMVEFVWGVSSEQGYDYLRFKVDGETKAEISGSADSEYINFEYRSVSFPRGRHTLTWEYSKDGSTDAGRDCGWIHGVQVRRTITHYAANVIGDLRCEPGEHSVIWDLDADGIELDYRTEVTVSWDGNDCSAFLWMQASGDEWFYVRYGTDLKYAPIWGDKAVVKVDGVTVLASTNSGSFHWQPQKTGGHIVTHESGGEVWTRYVYVEEAYREDVEPEPSSFYSRNPNMSISSDSQSAQADGGEFCFRVNANTRFVQWFAEASDQWISITSGAEAEGSGTVRYTVAENTGRERTGFVYAGGHAHRVTQAAARCELSKRDAQFGSDGGNGIFFLQMDTETEEQYSVYSKCDWMSVWQNVSGSRLQVEYQVAPYADVMPDRTGVIVAAGMEFTVTQSGEGLKLGNNRIVCGREGGFAEVGVTARPGEIWSIDAESVPGWIEAEAAGSAVLLTVQENKGNGVREAEIRIGSETLMVVQSGMAQTVGIWSESIVHELGEFAEGEIVVWTEGGNWVWRAVESTNGEFLHIESGSGEIQSDGSIYGQGSGTICYWMDMAAEEKLPRTAWVEVNGERVYITQRSGVVELEASGTNRGPEAGAGTIGVFAEEGVKWNVFSTVDWITAETDTGSGNGTVHIEWTANETGARRTGKVLVAGEEYELTQMAGNGASEQWIMVDCGEFDGDWWEGAVAESPDGKWRLCGGHDGETMWGEFAGTGGGRFTAPTEIRWTDESGEIRVLTVQDIWFSGDEFTATDVTIAHDTFVGEGFWGTTTITNLSISSEHIYWLALYHNRNLRTITLGEGAEMVHEDAFESDPERTELQTVDVLRISKTLWHIEDGAFETGIGRIELDGNNENFRLDGNGALYETDGYGKMVRLVKVPARHKGEFAIPSTVERVDKYAFNGCTGIKKVIIPDSVRSISGESFMQTGIVGFETGSGNANYKVVDGVLYTKDGETLVAYPPDRPGEWYAVEESAWVIDAGAFNRAKNLREVDVPWVDTICRRAFYAAGNLEDMHFGVWGGDLAIGEEAFAWTAIEELDFRRYCLVPHAEETWACWRLFEHMPGLKKLLVGDLDNRYHSICEGSSITDVYCWNDFSGEGTDFVGRLFGVHEFTLHLPVSSIQPESIDVVEYTDWSTGVDETRTITVVKDLGQNGAMEAMVWKVCDHTGETVVSPDGKWRLDCIVGEETAIIHWGEKSSGLAGKLELPNLIFDEDGIWGEAGRYYCVQAGERRWHYDDVLEVVTMEAFGLEGCPATEITIPEGIEVWGGISGMTGLTKVTLKGSGTYAEISDCPKLELIEFGEQVKEIHGEFTCVWNSNLPKVRIHETVRRIEPRAFYGDIGSFEVDDGNVNYKDIEGVLFTKDGKELVAYPAGKRNGELAVPAGTETIWENAFYNASNLTRVTLPRSIREIQAFAFILCENLSSLAIDGSGTLRIGSCAFEGCALEKLDFRHRKVIAVGRPFDGVFGEVHIGGLEWAEDESGDCGFGGIFRWTETTDVYCYGEVEYESAGAVGTCLFGKDITLHVLKGSRLPDTIEEEYERWNDYEKVTVTVLKDLDPLPVIDVGIAGDDGAMVTEDGDGRYLVRAGEENTDVVVMIPDGVEAGKVTVEVGVGTRTVKANGAAIRVVKKVGESRHDITGFLDIPAADGNGVVNLEWAGVKEDVAREALDEEKGAVVELGGECPAIQTAPTREGLTYTLREGETLEGMQDGDSTIGDGQAWNPEITVKGGRSGFYSIRVDK